MANTTSGTKLIFGCGYLGFRVAMIWTQAGEDVYAVTRSDSRAEQWRQAGILPIVGDITEPNSFGELPTADQVLFAVGFDKSTGLPMRDTYVGGLQFVLDRIPSPVRQFIYISSTGVYGQKNGEWVDETSDCRPTREGGRVCLEAEELLRNHHTIGPCSAILRMAGIYGPGRVPRLDAIRAGQPIAVAQGHLNLIHVDDAAGAVVSAAQTARLPVLLNISDGRPVLRREYLAKVAELAGSTSFEFVPAAADSDQERRASADKRVSNRRMRTELQFEPRYANYEQGLAAIFAQM